MPVLDVYKNKGFQPPAFYKKKTASTSETANAIE
jgi:hypothetical protein